MISSVAIVKTDHPASDLLASRDWAATALGPPTNWPTALASLVGLLLQSDQPMLVAWGPDLVAIYNDAHAALIGDRHPETFGRPLFERSGDVEDLVRPRFQAALQGMASRVEGLVVPIPRDGRRVSAYFDLTYTPVPSGDAVGGVLCLATETTAVVLSRNRDAALLELSGRLRGLKGARDIVVAGVHTLGKVLDANRVGFGEVQADNETILIEASYVQGVEALHGSFPLEGFGLDTIEAQRRGETVVHDDIALVVGLDQAAWEAIHTRAFASAPLIRDGRLRAWLYVNFREPHTWSPGEVALIEEVGARIWESLERARAEEALRSSEARFLAAVSAVRGVLWTNNARGEMIGEQPGWEALTGQTRADYEGYGWSAAVHPDDAQPTVEACREALEGRRAFLFEHRVRRRDGAWGVFSIRAMPIFDDRGEIREWVGVHTDVTEQRQAEADLRCSNASLQARIDEERALNDRLTAQGADLQRSQQSLSAIFGASSEGLTLCRLLTDASGHGIDYQVLDVNPAHRALTGATREQMLAKPVSQIAPPIDPRWIKTADKAVRSGKPQAFDVRSLATGRWLDIHVSPVSGDLFAQTFIDVTARHDAEEARRRLLAEMNHRVMNNFQMVAGVLELQANRSDSPEVRDQLQTAVRRVHLLSELHQNLATSPDSGDVDVRAYFAAVCAKLRATIDDPARIALKVSSCDARLDSAIAVPLGFVINELVTNAVKYAFPAPAAGEINVVFEPEPGRGYRLRVADGGQGLPEVVEAQGTGLGMRLVRAFVAQIDGALEIRHEGGVTYEISVPAPRASDAATSA